MFQSRPCELALFLILGGIILETNQILETIRMIEEENLDIRTITMGISLLDCIDSDSDRACQKIYEKNHALSEESC